MQQVNILLNLSPTKTRKLGVLAYNEMLAIDYGLSLSLPINAIER